MFKVTLIHQCNCHKFNKMNKLTDSGKSEKQYYASRRLKQDQELVNPCLQEHHLSLKCLNDNDYNQDACKLEFQNYNKCREFWQRVQADRRLKNIKPYLPLPEERSKIKAEFLKNRNKSFTNS